MLKRIVYKLYHRWFIPNPLEMVEKRLSNKAFTSRIGIYKELAKQPEMRRLFENLEKQIRKEDKND